MTLRSRADGVAKAMIATLIRTVADEERNRCIKIIKEHLLYNSQRDVSWHEVADTIDAILSGKDE